MKACRRSQSLTSSMSTTSRPSSPRSEVFDFDGALFKDLWDDRGKDDYFDYVRYHISDHRLLWAELTV